MNKAQQIPRPEYPRPQFVREDWTNLNGTWTFEFDFGHSGRDAGRELFKSKGFDREITVPFCPESPLSGVGHTDFIEDMWYHRKIEIPASWKKSLILLHFGAVDFESEVYIDGVSVGAHFGGSSSFTHDITPYVEAGKTYDLVVRVHDITRGASGQTRGKQCSNFKSAGCHYTRTTGIWQTVWLEAVSPFGIRDCQTVPDLDGARFIVTPSFHGLAAGNIFRATLLDGRKTVATAETTAADGVPVILPVKTPKTWSPESPFLYDLRFEVIDKKGKVIDTVGSYAGLRKVHIEGDRVFLNNKPIYLRLVLDQGFYPDGIWTAPTDEALRRDIELDGAYQWRTPAPEGLRGALPLLATASATSHGASRRAGAAMSTTSPRRATSSASGRLWCATATTLDHRLTPFNETGYVSNILQHGRVHIDAYNITKAIDPTRPVNDTSGRYPPYHRPLDDPQLRPSRAARRDRHAPAPSGFDQHAPWQKPYRGQPYMIDEFGGLKWIPPDRRPHADNTWGYGADIPDLETFYRILSDEVDVILSAKRISGYCYTQLTDVEQEQNGVYNYDRTTKFDMKRIRSIFTRKRPSRKKAAPRKRK